MPTTVPGAWLSSKVSSRPKALRSNITKITRRAPPAGSRISRSAGRRRNCRRARSRFTRSANGGAIERVQTLGGGKIIGLDTTVRTGALMVRKGSKIQSLGELRDVPIAVTWHAGTFYAAIEALEAAGVPFAEIKLVHA